MKVARYVSFLAMACSFLSAGSLGAKAGMPLSGPAPLPARQPSPASQQKPNVLIWMMDDVGFGQISSYGGLVDTPNIDRVAAMGLRYDNYHTAPVCSASRAAILTGRMPHTVHMGGHAAIPMDSEGYDGRVPPDAGTIAENLRQAGYLTLAVGKWDHLPTTDVSPAGPFTYWPQGQGFDRFYGFLAAETDQWYPNVVRDTTVVSAPQQPGHLFSADMADQAIEMIQARDARAPNQPFFMYWATGTAHAPHHAPREWIDKYRGRFDMGWDKARELVLKQQIAKGLVAKGTRLAPRPDGMPAWDSLSQIEKKLYARQMEVFAAALSYTDAQFGRVLDRLERRGELANTMVIVTSDNGASAEGGPGGKLTEAYLSNEKLAPLADNLRYYDVWGGPETSPVYHFGWAVAGNTPYRYYKTTTYEGGQRVPLVMAWPNRIAHSPAWRHQFVHVSDITPTILDTIGVAPAARVNNVAQSPMDGVSFKQTYAAVGDPRQARAQYAEMFGNRGLNWEGWSIVTAHRLDPWFFQAVPTFDEQWQLYDLVKDPGQTTDLAAKYPQRVAEMSAKFDEQARRYHVYPLHNAMDAFPGMAKKAAADFDARGGKWHYTGSTNGIPTQIAPPLLNRSFTTTVRLDLPRSDVTGPVFALGSSLGGISLYLDGGKPLFMATALNGDGVRVASTTAMEPGPHKLVLTAQRGPVALDGRTALAVTISADGKPVAEQTVHIAIPRQTSLAETFAVGHDDASPMLPGYPAGRPLNARIHDIVIDFNR